MFGTRRLALIGMVAAVSMLVVGASAQAALRVTVRPGDTLSSIGARYGVSADRLAAHNGLRDGNLIFAGRTLSIPGRLGISAGFSGGVYTVRAGDTLSGIATRTGTSVGSLVRANGLSSAHLIVTGTRLRIGSAPATTGPASATWIGGGTYTVRAGDNLGAIAARHGTSADALARMNGLANPNVLRVGQRLRVGGGASTQTATVIGGASHTVRAGETLSSIAARYGTSTGRLAALNGLRNPNALYLGTRLRVPTSGVVMSGGPLTPVTAATNGWGGHPSKSTISGLMARHASRYGVDPALVRAVGWQESGWWQGARSSSGAPTRAPTGRRRRPRPGRPRALRRSPVRSR